MVKYLLRSSLMAALAFYPCTAAESGEPFMITQSGIHTFNHYDVSDADSILSEVLITCHADGEKIGFISYSKILCVDDYALYSFYVYPEFRQKGYGTALLTYACNYLRSVGARSVYIQPGPFELELNGKPHMTQEQRSLKAQWLISFYKKNQFIPSAKWLRSLMCLVYECIGINEDAAHLMVKNF